MLPACPIQNDFLMVSSVSSLDNDPSRAICVDN